ncbi:VOC family protein [Streptomyces collinus]
MEFAFEAVDLERIRRFWSLVPGMDGLTISQGPVSSMRPVSSPLVGTVQELAETLTAMGGRVLEWDEGGWALMADPEGNEFYVRPPEDL